MFVGEKTVLRAVSEEDFSTFHEWWSDHEVLTHQSSGPLILRPRSANEKMFRSWVKESSTSVNVSVERKEDGVLIGQCSLWGLSLSGRYATLAIIFGRAFWNQGNGGEALALILSYAFNELNLNRVQLTVNANNPRAVRAYQKAGFQEEGRVREAFFRDGAWEDMLYMAVLRKDFQASVQEA